MTAFSVFLLIPAKNTLAHSHTKRGLWLIVREKIPLKHQILICLLQRYLYSALTASGLTAVLQQFRYFTRYPPSTGMIAPPR